MMAQYIGVIPHHVIAINREESHQIVGALYKVGFDDLAKELDTILFDGEWTEKVDE